jgi:hypothetical protein
MFREFVPFDQSVYDEIGDELRTPVLGLGYERGRPKGMNIGL